MTEPTDIVVRLRARTSELAHEAADEIVQLRKRLAKRERQMAQWRTRSTGSSAEGGGGVRSGDPETSAIAAGSLNINRLHYGIMTALRDVGTALNGQEIADHLGWPTITVVPRFPDMRTAHLIEADGYRVNEKSGLDQISYILTERGKQAVAKGPPPPRKPRRKKNNG